MASAVTSGVHDRKIDEDVGSTQWGNLGSWFIGPSAENIDEFCKLAMETIRHNAIPQNYFPEDPKFIGPEVKSSTTYHREMAKLETELKSLNFALTEAIPTRSVSYQGHMYRDTAMSAKLGFLSAWMTNLNNVSMEAGPVTIPLERKVGKQLCDLIGFESASKPLGSLTNGVTSANIEALWSSRNSKFFPLAVRKAIQDEPILASAKELSVYVPRLDRRQKLLLTSTWDLLNLNLDDIVTLPQDIQRLTGNDIDIMDAINKYSLATNGFVEFYMLHGLRSSPVMMASASNHFSWGKAATLLGMGRQNLICVPFDCNARMNLAELRKVLDQCLDRMVPLIAVICVIGTTEHGAVDPIVDILNMRAEYRTKGLNFNLLADAAWGGYFMTLLKKPEGHDHSLPQFPIKEYTRAQLTSLKDVDTVTLDPHKSGYCPFPAGGLCYRNRGMKSFLAFSTDMLMTNNCYGLQTSRPGAVSAGVYLAHRVIGLHSSGYGRILGQSMLGAKLSYCAWLTAADTDDNFVCVPLIPIPEALRHTEESTKQFIRDTVLQTSCTDLVQDAEAMRFLSEIGPDLAINTFAVNIKGNTCANICNRLNEAIFYRLSHTDPGCKSVGDVPLFLTKARLTQPGCVEILDKFKERLGISTESDDSLTILKNTVMNPWTAADHTIQILVKQFRKVVNQCIEEIDLSESTHL